MTSHNVDPAEINKFDAFAEDWWNPQGSLKTLHALNPVRLAYIQQKTPLAKKNILDVGCGGGLLTEALAKHQAKITGIDLSNAALAVAKAHAIENNLIINYQHIAVEEWAEQHAQTYDIVTCMEMLEHVPQPAQIIAACAKLLKPNGLAFFSTIHRNPKAFLYAIVGAEYLLNLLPKGTHHYAHFIRPSELDQWANAAHLSLQHISGVSYSPFSNTAALCQDIAVNYLTCYVRREPT